ncbi:hypothetical protein IQ247_29000 [Plectonema cf. radiosum LEGE 06105]|uniref:Uncharacterized protein n=1 Tax=Plectonema cf. radiosum LEGE 06105 TaxID=945769 RepID=A0A8J7F526_9CYAN|nr:hypothetical protein [Plectonema radiosum]MBE9216651.1 hypothetical protein [Plectonema cf. radiosum LEGE 06105]
MINWFFGSNNSNDESEDNSKIEDLSNPEFWEKSGIRPIVIDENDPDYIEKLEDEVCKRIEEAVEQLKKEK